MAITRFDPFRDLAVLQDRMNRLFNDSFQAQLEAMYRDTGAGEVPHPPALLCMVTLLQGYVGASDAEAALLREMVLAGFPVVEFGAKQKSLEDVFLHVTEGRVQ